MFQDSCLRKMIGHAREKDGLYLLEAGNDKTNPIYLFEGSTLNKAQIWLSHCCLGHPTFTLLKRMFQAIFEKLDLQSFHCDVCEFAKHHKVSFPLATIKSLFLSV